MVTGASWPRRRGSRPNGRREHLPQHSGARARSRSERAALRADTPEARHRDGELGAARRRQRAGALPPARPTPPSSATSRSARARSFADRGRRSTIRLPYTLPSRAKAPVVSVLSASLVAVPALSRVEPGQDLRSDGERDDDAGAPARHVRIARHEHGRGPAAPRFAERAAHEGSHPARRDPDDDVAGARPPPHLTRAGRPVVLGALHGAEDGAAAAGDDGLHERGRRVERGRALRGLDHAEPAAGARAHEQEPAAPRSARTISSMARPMAGAARPTAKTARRSARFMSRAIWSAGRRSSSRLLGSTRSVGSWSYRRSRCRCDASGRRRPEDRRSVANGWRRRDTLIELTPSRCFSVARAELGVQITAAASPCRYENIYSSSYIKANSRGQPLMSLHPSGRAGDVRAAISGMVGRR